MKITLSLLLLTLTVVMSDTTFMVAQQPLPAKYNDVIMPLRAENDSNQKKYFQEVRKTEILTDQLIAKTKRLEQENLHLYAENKRLRKVNEFLKEHIDTVYIRDTVFKRRKLLQIFKN